MNSVVNGFSRGLDHFVTETSAAQWERKYAVRGLLAAVPAGIVAGVVTFAGIEVVVLTAILVAGTFFAGRSFYNFLNRDLDDE